MPGVNEYKSVVGVDSVYYALITQDDANGYVAGAPASLAPAMNVKSTPSTASETQYADNGPYDNVSAEGDTALECEVPNLPESVMAALAGAVYDAVNGRVFDDADPAQAPYFALGYRFKKSNGSYRYRWYLKCRLEKPSEEAQSQSAAVNLKSTTLKITAMKTIYKFDLLGDASRMQGAKRVHGDTDDSAFVATSWFSAVQTPSAGSPAAFTLSSVPADAATSVAVDANIVLTFSNALRGGAEDAIILTSAAGVPVACARTINSARKVVTLNPSSNLSTSTDYLVVVPGVVDVHGQALANTVINFTTAS
jgi:phi13 family phage major tail protein